MSIIYLLLPLSLLLAVVALLAYIWATKSGQFDDLETPALRILADDTAENETAKSKVDQKTRD